tara:strand:+ start:6862 stop:7893 length:1032 start_codon:yes stop_codon:yes gene_type:complete
MSHPALSCKNLHKQFGNHSAVDSFNLNITKGELLALVGPSGCGKTTVLRLIAGLERLDAGQIDIAGIEVANPSLSLPPEKRSAGMVFQDFSLFPHMSLSNNVSFGMIGQKNAVRPSPDDYLELVGLQGFGNRMPHELSGGEQQRGALARALASEPEILLLDEPFSNLDVNLRTHVREEVAQIIRASQVTTLLVTHDIEEAFSIADTIAVMKAGAIGQVGTAEALYSTPANEEMAHRLGAANVLDADCDGASAHCELGSVQLQRECHGRRRIMLRPEWLSLTPCPDGNSRIIHRTYYGHDQMLVIELKSGARLLVRARALSGNTIQLGQEVSVIATNPATPFPL